MADMNGIAVIVVGRRAVVRCGSGGVWMGVNDRRVRLCRGVKMARRAETRRHQHERQCDDTCAAEECHVLMVA